MKKVTLTLKDVLELDVELTGLINQQTGEVIVEGLLSKELDLVIKYHLEKVAKQTAEQKQHVEKLRENLIKLYGQKEENDGWSLPIYINEVKDEDGRITSAEMNPSYIKFQEDFSKLLNETVDIYVKALTIDEVLSGVKSKSYPKVLFSLLEEDSKDNA